MPCVRHGLHVRHIIPRRELNPYYSRAYPAVTQKQSICTCTCRFFLSLRNTDKEATNRIPISSTLCVQRMPLEPRFFGWQESDWGCVGLYLLHSTLPYPDVFLVTLEAHNNLLNPSPPHAVTTARYPAKPRVYRICRANTKAIFRRTYPFHPVTTDGLHCRVA